MGTGPTALSWACNNSSPTTSAPTSYTPTYLFWFRLSGLGLWPLAANCPSHLPKPSRRRPACASDATDDTENNDRSVVTLSWLGDRRIRQATLSTGVWGVSWLSAASAEVVILTRLIGLVPRDAPSFLSFGTRSHGWPDPAE